MTKVPLGQFVREIAEGNADFDDALQEEEKALQFCSEIRKQLKTLRDRSGRSQEQVAQAMDISQPVVSRIENGKGDIGLLTIWRYLRAIELRMAVNLLRTSESSSTEEPVSMTSGEVSRGFARLSPSLGVDSSVFPIESKSAFYHLMDQAVVRGLGRSEKGPTVRVEGGKVGAHGAVQGERGRIYWVQVGPREGRKSGETAGWLGVEYRPEAGAVMSFEGENEIEFSEEGILHYMASHIAETFMDLPGVRVGGGVGRSRKDE